jgi:nucleoside-diphosphate-sugar epimerase
VRLLILGGTVFLGRHLVVSALDRGHEVTIFNRGRSGPGLFPHVEHLKGDRDGDLGALEGRTWDAAIDTSGYVPRVVSASARLLSGSVEHYAFVSSTSVYADHSRPGLVETAPLSALADPGSEDVAEHYGALKASCEQVVTRHFSRGALIVRPGLIVGPHDPTNRFTYWVDRVARGGDVLAPQPADQSLQLIDVRDLASWILLLVENRQAGAFNATGPEHPLALRAFLEACRETTRSNAQWVWVDQAFLLEHGVEPWDELPLWLAPEAEPDFRGFLAVDNAKAVRAGLTFRPLARTIQDTLEWSAGSGSSADRHDDGAGAPRAGLSADRERVLLDAWASLRRAAH